MQQAYLNEIINSDEGLQMAAQALSTISEDDRAWKAQYDRETAWAATYFPMMAVQREAQKANEELQKATREVQKANEEAREANREAQEANEERDALAKRLAEGKLETARRLLNIGMPIEQISSVTDISVDEILSANTV